MKITALLFPFLLISFLSRLTLTIFSATTHEFIVNFKSVFLVFSLGLCNDLVTYIYIAPIFLLLTYPIPHFFEKTWLCRLISKLTFFITMFALIFSIFSEFFFWEEFSTRFNFIAVDYLVYTREVIGNIRESYPLHIYIPIIFILTALYFILNLKFQNKKYIPLTRQYKNKQIIISCSLLIAVFFVFNPSLLDIKTNRFENELSKNGIYNLFSAFRNNELEFSKFYKSLPNDQALEILRGEVLANNQKFIDEKDFSIERSVKYNGQPKLHNVVLIVVESLSNEFIGAKTNETNSITPNLNKLASESMNFRNFYATGTRTVRGLEALSISVPPTPGSSIVRRPNNDNLFSISTVLKPLGYDMQFVYGGYGFFDNMNAFFAGNGFRTIDRGNMNESEISFSNVWGVADENLYEKAIKEANISRANNKKFFQLIMTTSNHRPFTFPDNRIDLPSGSGREAAVKYTDYAIGNFLEKAAKEAWFDDTIFIITADHCASSAGKTEIPIHKYHIPFFVYSPKNIKPENVDIISSQIDLAPTILGLLNISYNSKFFGNDIFTKKNDNLLMGTFQLLGFYQHNKFAILGPKETTSLFYTENFSETLPLEEDNIILNKAISYYQIASYLFKNGLMKETLKSEKNRIAK